MNIKLQRALNDKEKALIAQAISKLSKVTVKSNDLDSVIESLLNLIK